ncbi:hypothetical protein COB72_03475 [bacterium]|nr:MAG: hypothetical protein COB72_03475 [bacterium]
MIGSAATLGNFQAKLGMDSDDYVKGTIVADTASRVFGETFTSFVANPLLGSLAILKSVGKAMISGSVEALGYAESIERMSQVTGLSEQLLIGLQKQLELAGFSAERAKQAGLGLNKFLADFNNHGAMSADVLSQMGLSIDGLEGSDQIFRAVIESLSQIEDPATKAGLAARFFGEEAGPELINAIAGGNDAIDEMIDRYNRLGFVVDRRANSSMAGLNTTLGFTQQAIEGIGNNILIEFLLGISDSADLSNESIVRLAETLNGSLGPAAHEIGEFLAAILPVLTKIIELSNLASDGLGDRFAEIMESTRQWGEILGLTGGGGPSDDVLLAQGRNRQRGAEYLQQEEEFGL